MATSKHRHVAARLGFALLLPVIVCVAGGMRRGTEPPPPQRITVMTWNVYNGAADFSGVPNMQALGLQVRATHAELRAESIADIIDGKRPQIVCLQEVSSWSGYGSQLGFLSSRLQFTLQDRLLDLGLEYDEVGSLEVVFYQKFFEPPQPLPYLTPYVSWRETIVILARHSPEIEVVKVWNKPFQDFLSLGDFNVRRGWIAADIKFRGKRARYVCTQLEPSSSSKRQHQAAQMIDWLSGTAQPVIVMGDMASEPQSEVYMQFTNAGYADAWLANHGMFDGPTCCQSPNLKNAASELNRRTDYVFVRGAATVNSATRVGNHQADRTSTGLWPSDHAGVVAKIDLE